MNVTYVKSESKSSFSSLIPDRVNTLGVRLDVVNTQIALAIIDSSITKCAANYVCVRDVHGVMACQHDEELRKIHDTAGWLRPMVCRWCGCVA